MRGRRQDRRRASLHDVILERHAFGIIFLEPCFRDFKAGEDLDVGIMYRKNAGLLAHDSGGAQAASVASTKSKPETTGRGGGGRHHP
jgi:hypothetical protein